MPLEAKGAAEVRTVDGCAYFPARYWRCTEGREIEKMCKKGKIHRHHTGLYRFATLQTGALRQIGSQASRRGQTKTDWQGGKQRQGDKPSDKTNKDRLTGSKTIRRRQTKIDWQEGRRSGKKTNKQGSRALNKQTGVKKDRQIDRLVDVRVTSGIQIKQTATFITKECGKGNP